MAELRLVEDSNSAIDLPAVNAGLEGAPASEVLSWTRDVFGDDVILSSSFGAESALMLHLVKQWLPNVRVVFIDTGYLFPETYRFAEELTQRFDLDVRVYGPAMTPARQEALYGKRYEGDRSAIEAYLQMNKVEPMNRALKELEPRAWIAGLRRHQTAFRKGLSPVELTEGVYKIHPILNWNEEDVVHYMRSNDLPYHPLFKRGYRSIGDEHSTFPTLEGEDARAGRNLGESKECGIHLPRVAIAQSQKSSSL
jgi:phosphoadenosine phosphosulfate reductase